MQVQTELNGISYAIPNTLSPDGDTLILTNLRKKDNTLRPVTTGTAIGQLSQSYDHIYIHPVYDTFHWIGISDKNIYTDILSSNPQLIATIANPIHQIRHLGNTLILITESDIYYFLYTNNNYILLGNKPPFPYFSFYYLVDYSKRTKFSDIEGEITDLQVAMESLHLKNRWREGHAYYLCGAYLLSYAIRLYDNTYIRPSSPQFIYPFFQFTPLLRTTLAYQGNTFKPELSSVTAFAYQLKCTFQIPEELIHWKDIIAGIDVFISEELGAFSDTFMRIEECQQTITHDPARPNITNKLFYPQPINKQTLQNNIQEATNFYLIKTILLPENPGELVVILPDKNDISDLQNLVHQPTLPLDHFTHHRLSAGYSYIYNQRLHLANITTTFFEGFTLKAFSSYFRVKTVPNPNGNTVTRPGVQPDQPDSKIISRAYIEIHINTSEQSAKQVTTHVDNLNSHFLNPFFSYPDTRAYKAVIIYTDAQNNTLRKKELSLTPHPHLNIAYYIDPSLQEIQVPEITSSTYIPSNHIISIHENAKIKVSALQNPFLFLNENTYIASSQVLGMATNTRPLSEGQFGQFPLYIFTANGIYAMQIGNGDILYSNIVPVSQEIALPDTITPITDAVFFLTSRHAFFISAAQCVSVSPQLDSPRPVQNMQFGEEIISKLFPQIPDIDFRQFITQPDITIHHNYLHNEIILVSLNAGYSFVFNFYTKSWHTVTNTFSKVENSFPQLYGVIDNTIYNISEESGEPVPVLLLSRPLKFKSQQFKTLIRQILRCKITNLSDAAFFIYVSNDAENFHLKTDRLIPAGNYIDLDSNLIANCKYRYFSILFIANLHPDSHLDYLQTNYTITYKNDKLR